MINALLFFLWANLFTGGSFTIQEKNDNFVISITEEPHFNYNKYPNLNSQNYYIEYEYNIHYINFEKTVSFKRITTTQKYISIPKEEDCISVMIEIHPKGKNYSDGGGTYYIMGQKKVISLSSTQKQGTISNPFYN